MKIGANAPCPCGSGKKFKHCCKNKYGDLRAAMLDQLAQLVADNPDASVDELNQLAAGFASVQNSQGVDDFCGLSAEQMNNWMYAPFAELKNIRLAVPSELSASPVMRYLSLILAALSANNGKLKATARGNLPAKLVKQANELLPELALGDDQQVAKISDFAGAHEERFNALHYTRLLADISGIVEFKQGYFVCSPQALQQFNQHGVQPFYLLMLEAAVRGFKWSYLDAMEEDVPLPIFCMFMLWRLHQHGNAQRMQQELLAAMPDLSLFMTASEANDVTREWRLQRLVTVRFFHRFLEFWGFARVKNSWNFINEPLKIEASMKPLFTQTFEFD